MVQKLIELGAKVSIFDIDNVGLQQLQKTYSGVNCIHCDIADYDQVVQATRRYHEEFGAADILINNAGILYSEPLIKLGGSGLQKHDAKMWNKVIAADLSSVFYMTACVVEKMVQTRTKGVVVNISSVSA